MSPTVPAVSEGQLIANLIQGDRNSFTVIYKRYWYELFLVAHRRLQDKAVSEELVQEIFVQLWEKREALRIECLKHYLLRAIKYAVIDHIRTQVVRNKYLHFISVFNDLQTSEVETGIAIDDINLCVQKGLKSLPGKSQEIFRLSRVENWPVNKIATHLQLTEKGVEYHLTKSIKTLRVYLKDFV